MEKQQADSDLATGIWSVRNEIAAELHQQRQMQTGTLREEERYPVVINTQRAFVPFNHVLEQEQIKPTSRYDSNRIA